MNKYHVGDLVRIVKAPRGYRDGHTTSQYLNAIVKVSRVEDIRTWFIPGSAEARRAEPLWAYYVETAPGREYLIESDDLELVFSV